jgi:hypothetical protein
MGSRTVGVQRQYTGTAGRIENAQVAVYLTYAAGPRTDASPLATTPEHSETICYASTWMQQACCNIDGALSCQNGPRSTAVGPRSARLPGGSAAADNSNVQVHQVGNPVQFRHYAGLSHFGYEL